MATKSAEAAKRMRAAFKSQGWGRNELSVRCSNYSMGSSVRISIKSPLVDYDVVERVAECEEEVRRCEITHEILSGGNFFVFVEWDYEVRDEMAAPWVEPIQSALANIPDRGSELAPVVGADALDAFVGRPEGQWLAQLWLGPYMALDFTPDCVTGAAFTVALRMQEATGFSVPLEVTR